MHVAKLIIWNTLRNKIETCTNSPILSVKIAFLLQSGILITSKIGLHFYRIFNSGMKNVYIFNQLAKQQNGFFISIARGEGTFHDERSRKPISTIAVP